MPIDRVRHSFEVNVLGTLAVTQALSRNMAAQKKLPNYYCLLNGGFISGPSFDPYATTKHALESNRAELASRGIDMTLTNPVPYNRGFNDRMASSMWDWFGNCAISAPATDLFRAIGSMITTNQRTLAQCSDTEFRIKHDILICQPRELYKLNSQPVRYVF